MATTIVTKSGSGAPTASDLVAGELAVDLTNKRLYTEDSGGTVLELGTNPASDVTFGDNTKAIFGDGSDLQIYHDGSDSYIVDNGTGDLLIRAENNLFLKRTNSDETYFSGAVNGAVTLFHNNNAKLATTLSGVDITGSVTADGLTVGSSSVVADVTTGGSTPFFKVKRGTTSQANLVASFHNDNDAGIDVHGNGDISFYEDTGTTPKFFWDASAESLGIGTTSPATTLHVYDTINNYITLEANGATRYAGLVLKNSVQSWRVQTHGGDAGFKIHNDTTNNTALSINTSNNVGIGVVPESHYTGYVGIDFGKSGGLFSNTSGTNLTGLSNNAYLNSDASAWVYKETDEASYYNQTAGTHRFSVAPSGTAGTAISWSEAMRIDENGNVGIGTTSPASQDASANNLVISDTAGNGGLTINTPTNAIGAIHFSDGTSGADRYRGIISYGHSDNSMRFHTNTARAMTIDSSGNLLVGTTNASVGINNTDTGTAIGSDGYTAFSRTATADQSVLYVNKNTNDGKLVEFRKDGTTVGVIGSQTLAGDSELFIGNGGNIGLAFEQTGTDRIFPCNGSTGAERDAAIDLGSSSARFGNVYRSGSTISTSDRNMKQDIRDLTDAERNVAVAAKGLLKAFRFINTVEAEGDSANIHFGIIAQDLAAAFTAEGLDANDYQVYCADTFTDDDGNEQTRLGICYENLLAFIIAAI